jgi:hypothetical protein
LSADPRANAVELRLPIGCRSASEISGGATSTTTRRRKQINLSPLNVFAVSASQKFLYQLVVGQPAAFAAAAAKY